MIDTKQTQKLFALDFVTTNIHQRDLTLSVTVTKSFVNKAATRI